MNSTSIVLVNPDVILTNEENLVSQLFPSPEYFEAPLIKCWQQVFLSCTVPEEDRVCIYEACTLVAPVLPARSKYSPEEMNFQGLDCFVIEKTLSKTTFSCVKLMHHAKYFPDNHEAQLSQNNINCNQTSAFVLKCIDISRVGDSQTQNPLNEFSIQMKLSQRNPGKILSVSGCLATKTTFYAILPYFPDGDLMDTLSLLPELEENKIKLMFRSMIQSVVICHNSLICHRDISPENFLIQGDSELLLMDFGLSAEMDRNGKIRHSGPMGKLNYMAPELFSEDSFIDGRKTDVWSLGIILFNIITRTKPFRSPQRNDSRFRSLILQGELVLYFERNNIPVSNKLLNLMCSMLTYDPEKRITMDQLLNHPWFAC